MLTDPTALARGSFWTMIACILWVVVYIMFNDQVIGLMGDGAHALLFVSLVIGFSALIIVFMFRRHAAIRRQLIAGKGVLAKWQVSPEDWAAYVKTIAPETAGNRKVTLGLIVFFGITIPLVMALMKGKDFMIFAWIGLGVILVGLLGHWLGTRQERAHFIYRGGDCAFNADGIIVNGVYQGWGIPGSFLTSAELTPGNPGVLRLVYWFITKTGGQFVDVYAPVPATETARVEAAVAKLELHEHDEHKKPRRKAKSVPSVPEKPEA